MRPLDDEETIPRRIGVAVAIAALSTLATGLVSWGLDEVRERVRRSRREPSSEGTGT